MEASQASEAGSIPVARSTPARPRAGRFCYAHAGGIALHEGPARRRHAVRRLRVVQIPHHCRRGGHTPPTRPVAIPVGATKLARHGSSTGTSAKKLAQQAQKRRNLGFLSPLGELFRAFTMTTEPQGELFRARHDNVSKSKRSWPRRHIRAVHTKPPAPLLACCSELLKPTTPPHTCPSAPPASKDVQERIVSDLEVKLRRLNEAESATSEALGRLTDLRYLCMENSLYPREGTIA